MLMTVNWYDSSALHRARIGFPSSSTILMLAPWTKLRSETVFLIRSRSNRSSSDVMYLEKLTKSASIAQSMVEATSRAASRAFCTPSGSTQGTAAFTYGKVPAARRTGQHPASDRSRRSCLYFPDRAARDVLLPKNPALGRISIPARHEVFSSNLLTAFNGGRSVVSMAISRIPCCSVLSASPFLRTDSLSRGQTNTAFRRGKTLKR